MSVISNVDGFYTSYNPTTKIVTLSGTFDYTVDACAGASGCFSCNSPTNNWRHNLILGAVLGPIDGSLCNFPNLAGIWGKSSSARSGGTYTHSFSTPVAGRVYNQYYRGDWAFREKFYPNDDDGNTAKWSIGHESGGAINMNGCYCHSGLLSQSVGHYGSEPPLPPEENPTISAALVCSGSTGYYEITIENPNNTNVDYYSIRKSTGGTYTEVAKLYVSGGTYVYSDTTGILGTFVVYACNSLYDNDYPSNIVETNLNPVLEANPYYPDYPTLTFTAQTTNFCPDIDYVLWYLDGVLTGTTTGNTFTGVLADEATIYTLTAKYIKNGITGATSNEVQLILFYTGTTLSGFTSNGTMVIPNYFNRMEYLIVGGGGAGGTGLQTAYSSNKSYGGGGGAGGMLEGTVNNPVAGSYPVVVGSGGTNTIGLTVKSGANSSFYGLTAIGGGAGGTKVTQTYSNYVTNGAAGGSGGGGAGGWNYAGTGGAGTSGQGNAGAAGLGTISPNIARGGGGGGKTTAASAGNGGSGKSSSISGAPVTYAAGGGTRTTNGNGADATAGTGNGGQGGCADGINSNQEQLGGDGGSGVVWVYLYNYFPEPPIAPSGLTVSNITCDSLTLTWVNNDSTEVSGISVQQYSGSTWVSIANLSSGSTTYDCTGLSTYTNYQFRVVAYNDLFNTPSQSVFATTSTIYAPLGLTTSDVSCTGLILTWVNNSNCITGNYVEISDGMGNYYVLDTISSTASTYNLTGLTPNCTYGFAIAAYNDEFTVHSNVITVTTLDPTPFNVSGVTNYLQTSFTWDINDPAFGDSIIPELSVSGSTWVTGTTLAKNATGMTWTGLTFNTDYRARFTRTEDSQAYFNDCLAYWSCDESTGTTISDSTGNGHALTMSRDYSRGLGKNNMGLYCPCNSSNQRVLAGDALGITALPVSTSFWFKQDSTCRVTSSIFSFFQQIVPITYDGITMNYSQTNSMIEIAYGNGGAATASNRRTYFSTGVTLTTGVWYHVAVVFDDVMTAPKLWINGLPMHVYYVSGLATTVDFTNANFGIFSSVSNNNQYVDEFAIWNRELTYLEIVSLYRNGSGYFY